MQGLRKGEYKLSNQHPADNKPDEKTQKHRANNQKESQRLLLLFRRRTREFFPKSIGQLLNHRSYQRVGREYYGA